MSFVKKVKHFFRIDKYSDYLWINSKEYDSIWLEDRVIFASCRLTAKSKCNIILEENTCLSIENEFEGIIIGKAGFAVRIKNKFSGIISCDILICYPETEINGDLFINKLKVSKEMEFVGNATLGSLILDKFPIELPDIRNLTVPKFLKKYNTKLIDQNEDE